MANDQTKPGAGANAKPHAPLDPRQEAILKSQSYVMAERDTVLLSGPDLTAIRLMLEYMKPQMAFAANDVYSTIVLFGSTRVSDPTVAQERLDAARADAAAHPEDPAAARRVRVAEHLNALSRYYKVARDFAAMVSNAYQRPGERNFVIVTGGGPGIMEAGNRGAEESGHSSVGLNISLPHEQVPNPYITPDLCFRFRYFALRKMHFVGKARALVAFPGGFGTFDELFEVLCLIQTRTIDPVPVVLVGEAFWRRALDVEFLADQGVIDPGDIGLFAYAETAQDILERIEEWYTVRGLRPPQPVNHSELE